MAKTLDCILPREQNSFDQLRAFVATGVMLGHAFALHPTGGATEPVSRFFDFTYSGSIAVDVFFFLSGIFVTASYGQNRNALRFVVMRTARIWPGLLACLLVTALLVGPWVSSLPLSAYLHDPQTRGYVLKNAQLQQITDALPGVFADNHFPGAVNGSLWTLPIEIRCYGLVLVLGLLGGLRSPRWSLVLGAALAAIAGSQHLEFYSLFLVRDQSTTRLPLIFTLGIICYTHRQYIRIDWRISLLAGVAAVVFKDSLFGIAAFYLFLLNTALVLGAIRPTPRFTLPGDYSYGIYIYGFLIQQCVAHYAPGITSYPSLLLSVPLAVAVAALSWHGLERPMLAFARTLSRPDKPLREAKDAPSA